MAVGGRSDSDHTTPIYNSTLPAASRYCIFREFNGEMVRGQSSCDTAILDDSLIVRYLLIVSKVQSVESFSQCRFVLATLVYHSATKKGWFACFDGTKKVF